MTASPSHGLPRGAVSLYDLAGYALRQMIGIDGELIILKAARRGNFGMETAQCMEAICSPVVHLD